MNNNIIDVFSFRGQLLHIAQCSFTFSIVDVTVELQNLQSKEGGKFGYQAVSYVTSLLTFGFAYQLAPLPPIFFFKC